MVGAEADPGAQCEDVRCCIEPYAVRARVKDAEKLVHVVNLEDGLVQLVLGHVEAGSNDEIVDTGIHVWVCHN